MRTFTPFCAKDPDAKVLVNDLPKIQNAPEQYRAQMFKLGKHLADGILSSLDKKAEVSVVCTVEDADFLARGLIEKLENSGFRDRVHLICLWNDKIREQSVSLSPIVKEYKDPDTDQSTVFVVVKSIISGACVVKTNLTHAISYSSPEKIYVAAPVMLVGAEDRLAGEFPASINSKFEFIHFATDTEKDGENVLPGIGGSVYELLGLGNSKDKNKYVPKIVKERRAKYFGAPVLA